MDLGILSLNERELAFAYILWKILTTVLMSLVKNWVFNILKQKS